MTHWVSVLPLQNNTFKYQAHVIVTICTVGDVIFFAIWRFITHGLQPQLLHNIGTLNVLESVLKPKLKEFQNDYSYELAVD